MVAVWVGASAFPPGLLRLLLLALQRAAPRHPLRAAHHIATASRGQARRSRCRPRTQGHIVRRIEDPGKGPASPPLVLRLAESLIGPLHPSIRPASPKLRTFGSSPEGPGNNIRQAGCSIRRPIYGPCIGESHCKNAAYCPWCLFGLSRGRWDPDRDARESSRSSRIGPKSPFRTVDVVLARGDGSSRA